MSDVKIGCPKCSWEPKPDSRWSCHCGHVWNTFDTAGQCPSCHTQWEHTQCPSCTQWSLHIDWYKNLDDLLEDALEEIKTEILPSK